MDQKQRGTIYCRFDALAVLAERRWGIEALQAAAADRGFDLPTRLTRMAAARFVHIRQPSINSLANNTTARYDFTTIGRLCGFFGCTPGQLLVYVPAGTEPPLLTDPAILRWDTPPALELIVQTCISSKLSDIFSDWNTRTRIADATGLHWNVLRTQANPTVRRIDQRTLAGICAALPAQVDDLLEVQPCGTPP